LIRVENRLVTVVWESQTWHSITKQTQSCIGKFKIKHSLKNKIRVKRKKACSPPSLCLELESKPFKEAMPETYSPNQEPVTPKPNFKNQNPQNP